MEKSRGKDLVPVRLEVVKDISGNSRISVVTEAKETLLKMLEGHDHRRKIEQLKNEYNALIKEIKQMFGRVKSKKGGDPILYWQISDKIYDFLQKKAPMQGVFVTNYERTLARELNISPSRIAYFTQFRRLYPTVNAVDKRIKWSWYLELMKIGDAQKRKKIEDKIKAGQIKDINELKKSLD